MEGNQTAENFTGTPTGQFIPNNNQPESPPPPYDQVTQQRSNNQSNRRNENEIIGGTVAVYGTGVGGTPTIIINRIQSMIVVAYTMILALDVT
ncbi:unnamed protein product [Rotaria socialis]|uniref:Uncharacterized protein n=1 Tax=Rotaria socialis TaxID=392032 RepID=A0A817YU48_9BILA|nr:unnamed protein product [Rotaria socialis]